MNSDDRLSRRWLGMALSAAVMLGACGANAADDASTATVEEVPAELALDTADVDSAESDSTEAASEGSTSVDESPVDLADVELTPEMFEELKTDETQRAEVLEEMAAQGLSADEAECFLDNVSLGLFVTFGTGAQPDDDQFAELLQLLDTCEIAFGAES